MLLVDIRSYPIDGRRHRNKHLDNIPDGSTYGRVLGARINSGRATIDFSEAIHSNQNLDHMPNGTRAAWDSTAQKSAAVDSSGNLLLKNIGLAQGSTSSPSTTSATAAVIAEMTLTITTAGNKVLLTFGGAFDYNTSGQLLQTAAIAFFRDGTRISPEYKWDNVGGRAFGAGNGCFVSSSFVDTGAGAGSHTYDVRFREIVAAGTLQSTGTGRSFQVVELG